MSDARLPDWPEGPDELLAAEYALGVLDGGELANAESRADTDPAFARLVAAWQERLAPLADAVAETSARGEVWTRIEQRIGGVALVRAVKAEGWWNSLALWRWLTFGAGALAAACLALLLLSSAPGPAAPFVATISGNDGALFVAVIDEGDGTLSVMPMVSSDDPLHAHELWIIGKDEAPLSLGVIPRDGLRHVAFPPAHMDRARRGATLAVSLEPPGGSPNGKPTTVLGAGAIQRL